VNDPDVELVELLGVRTPASRALPPDLAHRVRRAAHAVFGERDRVAGATPPLDVSAAEGLVELSIELVSEELSGAEVSAARVRQLTEALRALVRVGREVGAHALEQRRHALSATHEALAQLRGLASVEQVVAHGLRKLLECGGFERVVLLDVDGGHVAARAAEIRGDAAASAALVAHSRSLPATGAACEALRRRIPVLVSAEQSARNRLDAVPAGDQGTGFVVAPVAPAGSVIALLYADRAPTGRSVDGLDRETLCVFAEGFGYALERATLGERLQIQAEQFRRLVATSHAITAALADAPLRLPARREGIGPAHSPSPPAAPAPEGQSPLSVREREVLAMLAEGARNRDIAERLCIAPDTVKSHMRNILRKLHARSRAEAVSRYLRLTVS